MATFAEMKNARQKFEQSCAEQNRKAAERVASARATGAACVVTPMLAFGGTPYCTTHRVMGPCPFAKA